MPTGVYDRSKAAPRTKTAGGSQEMQALARKLDAVDRKITTALASLKPLADERQQLRQQIDAVLKAGDRAITGATIPNGAIDRPPAVELGPTIVPAAPNWDAARLRRIMAILDIDAEELAKRAGVTTATVRDWTTGAQDVDRAPLSVLNKLAALDAQTRGVTA